MWKFFICSCQHPFSSSVPAPPPHLLPHAGSCLPTWTSPMTCLSSLKASPSHTSCGLGFFKRPLSFPLQSVPCQPLLPRRGSLKQHKTAFPQDTQSPTLVHQPDPFRASTHSISTLNCASPNSLCPYLEPQSRRITCPHDACLLAAPIAPIQTVWLPHPSCLLVLPAHSWNLPHSKAWT